MNNPNDDDDHSYALVSYSSIKVPGVEQGLVHRFGDIVEISLGVVHAEQGLPMDIDVSEYRNEVIGMTSVIYF